MPLVLISGGAGFIGSRLAGKLLSKGWRVRILDNLSPQIHGDAPTAGQWLEDQGAEFVLGSVTDEEVLAKGLEGDRIHQPFHAGRGGHPVGFGSRCFPELAQLSGEEGGRPLLERHDEKVLRIELEDAGILKDVDTPAQLAGV